MAGAKMEEPPKREEKNWRSLFEISGKIEKSLMTLIKERLHR
jgi:hypothetical protein